MSMGSRFPSLIAKSGSAKSPGIKWQDGLDDVRMPVFFIVEAMSSEQKKPFYSGSTLIDASLSWDFWAS